MSARRKESSGQYGVFSARKKRIALRLGERPAVLEDEQGNPAVRIEREVFRRPRFAAQDVHLDPLVRNLEMRQEQADLVPIARLMKIIETKQEDLSTNCIWQANIAAAPRPDTRWEIS